MDTDIDKYRKPKIYFALFGFLIVALVYGILNPRGFNYFQLPIKAAAAASPESLIKAGNSPAVYYLGTDNKRYVFPNEATFLTWYTSFDSVVNVSGSELAKYPLGGNIVMRPGTKLVKTPVNASVYAVLPNGVLLKIKDEAQATILYGTGWQKRVVDLPEAIFVDYVVAGQLADAQIPAGSLVKKYGTGDYYYFDGITYRHISDMVTLKENRFHLENALALEISSINVGNSIKGRDTSLLAQIQNNRLNNPLQLNNLTGTIALTDVIRATGGGSGGGGTSGNSAGGGNQTPAPAPPVNSNSNYSISNAQHLIHDQSFVIPANAFAGDVVGRLNSFWKDRENRSATFLIVDANNSFTVDNDGVIKITDTRSLSGQSNITIKIRAEETAKQIYEEANITIKVVPTASTVFVDPSASTNGNGTRENPYKSWAGITISSDRNYLQKRGTEISLSQRINIGANNNVIIGSYGNAVTRPKVKIYNLKGGTNAAISMTGSNNTVRDIEIDAKLSITGIYSGGGDNNRIDGVLVQNSEWGLRTMNPANNFKVINSEIGYTGDDGHYSQNHDNMEIAHNYIHHVNQHWNENSYWYRGKTEALAPGDGIQLNGTIIGFNIHHNIIDRSDTDNKFCVIVSPIQNNAVSNGRLEYNHCTLRANGHESGFYIYRGVFGAKVRYNTFVNGTGVYSHSKDLIVSNNDFIRSRLFTEFGGDSLVFDNKFID